MPGWLASGAAGAGVVGLLLSGYILGCVIAAKPGEPWAEKHEGPLIFLAIAALVAFSAGVSWS